MTKAMVMVLSFFWLVACAKNDSATTRPPAAEPPAIGPGKPLKASDFPNVTNSIFGAWNSDTAEFGDDMLYLTTLYFNDRDEVGWKRTCIGSGEQVEVATVVSGRISRGEMDILEAARLSQKGGRISDCTLIVNKGSFKYALQGDRLEITFWSGDTRSYTRSVEEF